MDLSTRYLGFTLKHPLILGASPLVDNLDTVRRVEDAGVAAIVMHSLFEEQVATDPSCVDTDTDANRTSDEPLLGEQYLQAPRGAFPLGPEEYLEQVRRIKEAGQIPVIASLNGTTSGAWLNYARLLDQAGADALEVNVYRMGMRPEESAEYVESKTIEILQRVKSLTKIPVAVKLSPFYTALSHFVARLTNAGADGVVLFNRFYQPDIDLERLEVLHQLDSDLDRAAAEASLAGDSVGANSVLSRCQRWRAFGPRRVEGRHDRRTRRTARVGNSERGPRRVREILGLMERWLEAHGHDSLAQIRGKMNLANCPDPAAYERINHVHILNACARSLA